MGVTTPRVTANGVASQQTSKQLIKSRDCADPGRHILRIPPPETDGHGQGYPFARCSRLCSRTWRRHSKRPDSDKLTSATNSGSERRGGGPGLVRCRERAVTSIPIDCPNRGTAVAPVVARDQGSRETPTRGKVRSALLNRSAGPCTEEVRKRHYPNSTRMENAAATGRPRSATRGSKNPNTGSHEKRHRNEKPPAHSLDCGFVQRMDFRKARLGKHLVAGTGFEPVTSRL